MTTHAQTDDFDISKAIFDQLKDLPPERQQRVLRWVSEGLGVAQPAIAPQTLQASEERPLPLAAHTVSMGAQGSDVKSFIAAKAPKSDQQFAAAVAYFYRFEAPPAQRRDVVDGNLLQEAARLAGRKRLSNPRATLNNAKSSGYLDGISPGEFTINSVGENLVAMTLPGEGEAPPRPARKKRSKKPVSKSKAKTKKR